MPSPRPLFAVALLAAVCLVGCGNPSAKLLGKWKMSGISGAEGNPLAGMMAQMMKIGFEFKADGSCISSVEALAAAVRDGDVAVREERGDDLVVALTMPPANIALSSLPRDWTRGVARAPESWNSCAINSRV